MSKEELGQFIKTQRTALGMNQAQFQKKLEEEADSVFPLNYISLIERCLRDFSGIDPAFLQALSKLTKIPLDKIMSLNRTGERKNDEPPIIIPAGSTLAESIEAILVRRHEPAFRKIIREKAEQIAGNIEQDNSLQSWVSSLGALSDSTNLGRR